MARALRYVPAGLLCVLTLSSAAVAGGGRQAGSPARPPQTPALPSTSVEIPIDPQSLRSVPALLSTPCYTMQVIPVDPSIDKGFVTPVDPKNYTMQVVPAPPCVVPPVAAIPGQRGSWSTYPEYQSPNLPTNRTLPFIYNFVPSTPSAPTVPLAPSGKSPETPSSPTPTPSK